MEIAEDQHIGEQQQSKYAQLILECDENMHQQKFKEVCDALREAKLELEAEEDGRVIDNDFNARAGLCALQLGQAEEALQFTEMVNLNNPGTLLIHTLRGWSLKEIGYEKRANVLFNYVLNQVSETNSVMDSMGAAISSQLLGSELSLFFYEQAISQFDALENPEKKLDLIWVVHALTKKNDMSSTVKEKKECLLKALQLTQSNLDVYISLAELFFRQGKFSLALQCYLKSIEINASGNLFRQIKIGFIYFYFGEIDHSLEFLSKYYNDSDDIKQYFWVMMYSSSIYNNPKISEFDRCYQIGLLLYHLQFLQSSLLMLQRAKQLQPKNYKLGISIYLVHTHLRQFQEAITQINELLAMKQHEKDVTLIIILAELYYMVGNVTASEQYLLKAISLTPNQTFSLYKYVKFLNKENRLEESLKYIQKAIDIEPKKIKLLIMKALIYSSLKDLPQAYITYEEVLKINSTLQSTKFQLSQINYVLKKYSLAFDQMANIQEGEVGYEKSLNLLIKLFISQPHELTPAQLEFANTKLRTKISEHLLSIGEVGIKKRIKDADKNSQEEDKQSKNIESLESEKNMQNEEFEVYKQLGESDGESYEEFDEMEFKINSEELNETHRTEESFYQILLEVNRDKARIFEQFSTFRQKKLPMSNAILLSYLKKYQSRIVEPNDIDVALLKSKLRQLEQKAPPLKLQRNSVFKSDQPMISKLKKTICKNKDKSVKIKCKKTNKIESTKTQLKKKGKIESTQTHKNKEQKKYITRRSKSEHSLTVQEHKKFKKVKNYDASSTSQGDSSVIQTRSKSKPSKVVCQEAKDDAQKGQSSTKSLKMSKEAEHSPSVKQNLRKQKQNKIHIQQKFNKRIGSQHDKQSTKKKELDPSSSPTKQAHKIKKSIKKQSKEYHQSVVTRSKSKKTRS